MAHTDLPERFQTLKTAVSAELLERPEPIETGVLAIIAGQHHFQLGVPGVAKSALIERFLARIGGLPEGGYFHYLLDKFTKPEELFGPPNLKKLMEDHQFVREIEFALPSAYFAFIDEIFKGNSSVLNSLLLIMNERTYNTNRGPQKSPLISIFAASNELPEDNTLSAMWDRLHIRHWVEPLTGGTSFKEMLTAEWDPDPKPLLTLEEIHEAREQARQVTIGDAILDAFFDLRVALKAEALEPSDRRWRCSLDTIKAAAWLAGRDYVEIADARVLSHMLWETDETRRKVQTMCLDLADPLERELQDFYDDIRAFEHEWRTAVGAVESESDRQAVAVEIWTKAQAIKTRTKAIAKIAATEGREMPTVKALRGSLDALTREILQNGFDLEFAALMIDDTDND